MSTHCLTLPIPRVHIEDILHSAVRVCRAKPNHSVLNDSDSGLLLSVHAEPMQCSTLLEPRLDCLLLEDVGHATAAILHIVTTLQFEWQPLSSWMASVKGKNLDNGLAFIIRKVCLGVMGSLRDMCQLDKRPPRKLYTGPEGREPKLAAVFLVHKQTGDVLSLLPFVSLPRMYRSSNHTKDEDTFRMACASLALAMLYAHVDCDQVVQNKQQELKKYWGSGGSLSNAKEPVLAGQYLDSATAVS